MERNGGIAGVTFDALTVTGNAVKIKSNPALTVFSADYLTTIAGYLEVSSNGSLPDLTDVLALTSIGGSLTIENNDALDLSNGELGAITTVSGNIDINGNAVLTAVVMPALTTVSGSELRIENNALTSLDLSALTTIDSVYILGEPDLTTLGPAWVLTAVGDTLSLVDNDSLGNVAALAAVTTVPGELEVKNNGALTTMAGLAGITTAGQVSIEGNDLLTGVTINGLTTTSAFILRDNDALSTVSFAGLTTVGGLFQIASNDGSWSTTAGSFPALTTISGNLEVWNNLFLGTLSLPVLASIGATLEVEDNPSLTSVALPLYYVPPDGCPGIGAIGNLPIQGSGSTPAACADLNGISACVMGGAVSCL